MGDPCAKIAENANEEQIREILGCLEAKGAPPESKLSRRANKRWRLEAPCAIHYLSPDGQTVFESSGTVREISRVGLSLLCRTALEVNTDVHLTVTLPEGRTFNLTGSVVYLRDIRPESQLMVVRLRPVNDKRLTEFSPDKIQAVATMEDEASIGEPTEADQEESESALSARERSLRLLSNAARHGVTSKETLSKVVRLTFSPDFAVRRATIPALYQVRGPDAAAALLNLLHDPSAQIQAEAAEILGRMEVTSAIEPLKKLLAHDNEVAALRAAEALGRLKDDSGLAVAIRHLRSDHSHARLAAQTFGVIVGQTFRPTPAGVAGARRYLKKARL